MNLFFSGTKGRTKPKLLECWFRNNFEKGQEDTYVIEAEDVGEPLMIKLENDQGGLFHRSSDWFVEKVLISSSVNASNFYEFPCKAWVKRESVFFEGKGKRKTTLNERHLLIEQFSHYECLALSTELIRSFVRGN